MKNKQIVEAIYGHYHSKYNGEFRPHLGASMGGDPCLRKLWYSFRWSTMVIHEGRMQRLFQRGHREEEYFQEDLTSIGIQVITGDEQGNQYRLVCPDNRHIGGSTDGYGEVKVERFDGLKKGEWLLVEMKTHNEKSFKLLNKDGVQITKPLHYSQMQIYMRWSGLNRALYIAVNKNTDELYTEIVQYNQAEAESVESRMISVVEAKEPPPKLHTDASRFECKYCDYNDICHTDRYRIHNSCRSCVFAMPFSDGNWGCQKYETNIVDQNGCASHIILPHFLENVANAVDSCPDQNFLVYEFENGVRFKNGDKSKGSDILTSNEVSNIVANGYACYDENLVEIRNKLDGTIIG